jgi:hypothetical protein
LTVVYDHVGVPFFPSLRILLGRLSIVAQIIATAVPATAAESSTKKIELSRPIIFDLSAQPLYMALETYASLAGRQVVYEGSLTAGRWSAPVKGTFPADVALQMLLTGTGLSVRYMAEDGFVLVPDPTQRTPLFNTAPQAVVSEYYARIQNGLRRAFCADNGVRSKGYRIPVALWIGRSGDLMRGAMLDSTGDSDLDAALDRTIHSVVIGGAPPAGFAQPVIMLISSDLARDCLATQDRQQLKAER